MSVVFLFFFQAEDGIRDGRVTGVQTCALPIYRCLPLILYRRSGASCARKTSMRRWGSRRSADTSRSCRCVRSEERRVGKEWRTWGAADYLKKKKKKKMREVREAVSGVTARCDE